MHLAFHRCPPRDLAQLKAVVRAKGDAPSTVDTDKRVSCWIEVDGVHGAGMCAFPAANAQIFPDDDTPVPGVTFDLKERAPAETAKEPKAP